MRNDYLNLALSVGEIARKAGITIMEIYESKDYSVEHKEDESPITHADRKADALIHEGLRQLEFQAPIISEEGQTVAYQQRSQYTRYWLVDPLDGTREFVDRNGDFTVNIALIENGRTVMGVIYVPVTEELYYGADGQGAWLVSQKDADPQRIEAASFSLDDNPLKILTSRNHQSDLTRAYLDQFPSAEIIKRGSSLKLLALATGEAHLYPRFGTTMEWDIAAGHAILQAAGGKIVNEETGKTMVYNKPDLENPHFIAYGNVQAEPQSC